MEYDILILPKNPGEIKSNLQVLAFPFKPDDVELKSKIAEKLPLSIEELTKKETELNEKSERLKGS